MVASEIRNVYADDTEITFLLERKKVKNLNLRIRNDGTVFVSANSFVSSETVDEFVRKKKDFILRAVSRFRLIAEKSARTKKYVSGETFYFLGRGLRLKVIEHRETGVNSDGVYIYLKTKEPENCERNKKLVEKFMDMECKRVFSEILDELYPVIGKYGVKQPLLRIRDMKTRWGSCLPGKETVTLNKRLIEKPRNCIEYVVMHELCHFVHPNHSKAFYGFLASLMPDWRERKEWLEGG